MNKFIRFLMLSLAVAGLLVSPPVLAQEVILQPDNNTPINRLQANCDTVLGTLRRIHTNDTLLRVNIGQMYTGISVRLMARLNSRLALNRIDSSNLVDITSRFEEQRRSFSDSYSRYEASLSAVIKENCKINPAKFYEQLLIARDERDKLAQDVKSMNDSITEYSVAVEQLNHRLFSTKSGETNATN